ncbi:MAG: hypothetical protein KJ702_13735, partial [Gammaproteobacteria bacterium]|nr:hypothetical protein [Gammaproteobacteria bacterium]
MPLVFIESSTEIPCISSAAIDRVSLAGLSGSALAKETLSMAADELHRISVEDSMKTKGIVDAYGKVINNL